MVIRTPSELKAQMPISQVPGPGKVYSIHIHDVVDTLESRTAKPVISLSSSYSSSLSQNGARYVFNSPTPVSLTILADSPVGYNGTILQVGVGAVSLSPGTLLSRKGHGKTAGAGSFASFMVYANSGNSPQIVFSGDTAPNDNWLNDVTNFGVWLTLSDPAEIGASEYDLMIIDPDEQTPQEMPVLRARPGGGQRKLAAYLSVGEAVDYRWYWQSSWSTTPPSWLGSENPNWPGAFRVQYWEEEWKNIIYGSGPTSGIGRILAAGFDAAFLDVVDTYAHWEGLGRATAADEMVQLVTDLSAYAKSVNPDFKIIAQNSPPLLLRNDYLAAIDGVSIESMWFLEEVPLTQNDHDWLLPKVANARNAGKRILNIEYTDEQSQIDTIYDNNAPLNHLTYIGPRALDVLWHRTPTP